MDDPFLTGLIIGALVGFAGLWFRLFRSAVIISIGALGWLVWTRGIEPTQQLFSPEQLERLEAYLPLFVGLALGAVLGRTLLGVVMSRGDSGRVL